MTTAQKIIKNLAIAFACVLIVSIISGILSALYALSGVLGLQREDKKIKDEMSMINFENSEVATLDIDVALDMGVGKFEVTSAITGNSKINAGIGNLELNIQANKDNYTIKADKGIGSIKIDGKEVAEDVTYGDGENSIKIDGGIGSIKIDFKED